MGLHVIVQGRVAERPGYGLLQIGRCLPFVQPALIVWNDCCGADEPHARFLFLNQHLATGKLLAERNLAVVADDLNRGGGARALMVDFRTLFVQ